MAHVAFVGAGDGIEEPGPVQAEHFLTSRDGRLVLDGLVLLPFAHDLSGDTTLFRQLCVFIFLGDAVKQVCEVAEEEGGLRAAGRRCHARRRHLQLQGRREDPVRARRS